MEEINWRTDAVKIGNVRYTKDGNLYLQRIRISEEKKKFILHNIVDGMADEFWEIFSAKRKEGRIPCIKWLMRTFNITLKKAADITRPFYFKK